MKTQKKCIAQEIADEVAREQRENPTKLNVVQLRLLRNLALKRAKETPEQNIEDAYVEIIFRLSDMMVECNQK